MKAYLRDLLRQSEDPAQGRDLLREYLQARILGSLQRLGGMVPLAFHGGTALRFLYSIPRYSEDLDFALENRQDLYDLRAYSEAIRKDFTTEGYAVEIELNNQSPVHSAFVRFPGLLYELELSPNREKVVAVKIEVDTNPPEGAGLETTVVRCHGLLQLQHHDRASLLAGKLHALLHREYTKGRDLYDLMWYLSDPNWPPPNLALLNNALAQTGWGGERFTPANWKTILRERLKTLRWRDVAADVRPFLESSGEVELLTLDHFDGLLRSPPTPP